MYEKNLICLVSLCLAGCATVEQHTSEICPDPLVENAQSYKEALQIGVGIRQNVESYGLHTYAIEVGDPDSVFVSSGQGCYAILVRKPFSKVGQNEIVLFDNDRSMIRRLHRIFHVSVNGLMSMACIKSDTEYGRVTAKNYIGSVVALIFFQKNKENPADPKKKDTTDPPQTTAY